MSGQRGGPARAVGHAEEHLRVVFDDDVLYAALLQLRLLGWIAQGRACARAGPRATELLFSSTLVTGQRFARSLWASFWSA